MLLYKNNQLIMEIIQTEIKEVLLENCNKRYFATKVGEIYSLSKSGVFKLLKPHIRKDNYMLINVLNNSERKENGLLKNRTIPVHRMVASAWLNNGDYYFCNVVNHKDSNTRNNNIENLEIVTTQENIIHCYKDKITGVYKHSKSGYTAVVNKIYLGYYETECEASQAVYNYYLDNTDTKVPKYINFHPDINKIKIDFTL